MSDDTKAAVPSPSPPVAAPASPSGASGDAAPSFMGVPMASFVRGGGATFSSQHQKNILAIEDEAELRRDAQDRMRQAAAIPVDQGGAKLYSQQTGTPQETPKVLLTYLTPGGAPWIVNGKPVQCLADVIVGVNVEDLVLQLVCPRCRSKNVPQGQCQLTIRQSNRKWHLDTSGAGQLLIFDEQPYLSAGTVMDGERFSCPDCGWAAQIDKNYVRQEAY